MPPSNMAFSGHYDDDIIFMNPDIQGILDRGEDMTTVYFVSTPDNLPARTLERETGIKAAYTEMTGLSDWVEEVVTVNGNDITSVYLDSMPNVRLYFLRFGPANSAQGDLQELYDGDISELATNSGGGLFPAGATYTKDSLTQTLTSLMEAHNVDNIMMHARESADVGGDHPDHFHSADFVWDARLAYSGSHDVDEYVGYGSPGLPENVTDAELAAKVAVFEAYANGGDPGALNIPVFREYLTRQYYVDSDGNATEIDYDIRTGQPVVPVPDPEPDPDPTSVDAADDTLTFNPNWAANTVNLLANDAGSGLSVTKFDGFVDGIYLSIRENGDVWTSDRGQFANMSQGETRSITFDYEVTDADGNSDTASVELTSTAPGTPPPDGGPTTGGPDASDDVLVFNPNWAANTVNLLANDAGSGLSVTKFDGFLDGIYLSIRENGDVWTSDRGQFANLADGETRSITFDYEVTDANGNTDTASVELTSSAPPSVPPTPPTDALMAEDDELAFNPSWTSNSVNLLDNDVGDGLSVTRFDGFVDGIYLSVRENGDVWTSDRGQFSNMSEGETRSITFDYEVTDANGNTDTAQATLAGLYENDSFVF